MPEGLDIDRKNVLNGTMSPHAQHLVVSSGRSDWASKIEDERATAVWGRFTAEIKGLLGRGGEFHDVCSRSQLQCVRDMADAVRYRSTKTTD